MTHGLHLETQAAQVLREQLIATYGDDDADLIRDMIEGETSLRDMIAMTASEIVKDIGAIDGLDATIKRLKDRKDRIEKRISMSKTACLTAMQIAEISKLETHVATISRKSVPPSPVILEEGKIPSEFWKPQDPKLDKKAVLDALKAGKDVPGAQLSNGSETIQFRT